MNDKFSKKIVEFLTNRLFVLTVLTCLSFFILLNRLFDLQIVNGEYYQNMIAYTTIDAVRLKAPRGTIYDAYGRPLAINNSAFSVKIDPSAKMADANYVVANLVELFEKTGQKYVDDFPITNEPFKFTFDGSETREKRWKEDMRVPLDATPEEAFLYLRNKLFALPEELSNEEARKILSIRSMIYLRRYNQLEPITIAFDANTETIITLEEENEKYTGVYVDIEPLREYPEGIYFSHILGYIRKINDADYELNKDKDYKNYDMFGESGLERSFESELRGVNGETLVEVDNFSRPVQTVSTVEPIQGDKIFLTLDANLQKSTYHILEDTLIEVLKGKLQGKSSYEKAITEKQFFSSLIQNYMFNMEKILNSEEETYQSILKRYILQELPTANTSNDDELNETIKVLVKGVENGAITSAHLLLAMKEQEIITLEDIEIQKLSNRTLSSMSVILNKLDSKEITPQMTNLNPSTGSVVVVDVKTGGVLASVTYPSYDNNQFVNNFNNEYWYKLNNYDKTLPMLNRPFSEPRAPGSTFKMITALAALRNGTITPDTKIYDYTTFTSAGLPYLRCHSSVSHGLINVVTALEVSCNYFFNEATYRMGNSKNGGTYRAIEKLNEVMIDFGLNDRTGVEIGELYDAASRQGKSNISSPEYKENLTLARDKDASKSDLIWYDGDTVQTSIGQGKNSYTAANMAKYIATLANKGTRLQMHFFNKQETQAGDLVKKFEPVLEKVIDIPQEHLDVVYKGMYQVVNGSRGTARSVFSGFPINVAGKTGTAEESGPEHTSFGGFAPFEEPQIAVYVLIPNGDTKVISAPSTLIAKKIIEEYMGFNREPQKPMEKNTLCI